MDLAKSSHQVVDTIGRQEALDGPAEGLQKALNGIYDAGGPAGQQIENVLHGTPLGHPLHPILITIPVGAWTVTQICDLIEGITGNEQYQQAADTSLTIGLVGALASAVSGMTDWKDIDGEARRIGLVHGMLNSVAAGLYAGSLMLRQRNARGAGRQLALLGYSLVMLSGYLGGELVYRKHIGVSFANDSELPGEYNAVLNENELAEGELRRVEVNDSPVVLARQNGQVYALAERCAHLGGPLADGQLEEGSIRCPWHGSRFALEDGRVIEGPSAYPQPCLAVRIREGKIEVRANKPTAVQG
jgi:nitrite reductase/ring-hydroxylating ferredoxin subunit/uncharacterized membrane protein